MVPIQPTDFIIVPDRNALGHIFTFLAINLATKAPLQEEVFKPEWLKTQKPRRSVQAMNLVDDVLVRQLLKNPYSHFTFDDDGSPHVLFIDRGQKQLEIYGPQHGDNETVTRHLLQIFPTGYRVLERISEVCPAASNCTLSPIFYATGIDSPWSSPPKVCKHLCVFLFYLVLSIKARYPQRSLRDIQRSLIENPNLGNLLLQFANIMARAALVIYKQQQ